MQEWLETETGYLNPAHVVSVDHLGRWAETADGQRHRLDGATHLLTAPTIPNANPNIVAVVCYDLDDDPEPLINVQPVIGWHITNHWMRDPILIFDHQEDGDALITAVDRDTGYWENCDGSGEDGLDGALAASRQWWMCRRAAAKRRSESND